MYHPYITVEINSFEVIEIHLKGSTNASPYAPARDRTHNQIAKGLKYLLFVSYYADILN
jgi:hypothetical protein